MDLKIWIINDNNKIISHMAHTFQDIPLELRNSIVAGPFTQEEYLSRLKEPNFKAKKYWILSIKDVYKRQNYK